MRARARPRSLQPAHSPLLPAPARRSGLFDGPVALVASLLAFGGASDAGLEAVRAGLGAAVASLLTRRVGPEPTGARMRWRALHGCVLLLRPHARNNLPPCSSLHLLHSHKEGPLFELSPTGLASLLEAIRHLAAPDCQGPGLVAAGGPVLAALLSLLQARRAPSCRDAAARTAAAALLRAPCGRRTADHAPRPAPPPKTHSGAAPGGARRVARGRRRRPRGRRALRQRRV